MFKISKKVIFNFSKVLLCLIFMLASQACAMKVENACDSEKVVKSENICKLQNIFNLNDVARFVFSIDIDKTCCVCSEAGSKKDNCIYKCYVSSDEKYFVVRGSNLIVVEISSGKSKVFFNVADCWIGESANYLIFGYTSNIDNKSFHTKCEIIDLKNDFKSIGEKFKYIRLSKDNNLILKNYEDGTGELINLINGKRVGNKFGGRFKSIINSEFREDGKRLFIIYAVGFLTFRIYIGELIDTSNGKKICSFGDLFNSIGCHNKYFDGVFLMIDYKNGKSEVFDTLTNKIVKDKRPENAEEIDDSFSCLEKLKKGEEKDECLKSLENLKKEIKKTSEFMCLDRQFLFLIEKIWPEGEEVEGDDYFENRYPEKNGKKVIGELKVYRLENIIGKIKLFRDNLKKIKINNLGKKSFYDCLIICEQVKKHKDL